jgi:ribosomal protein S18 acetylase RimI-like enzyme
VADLAALLDLESRSFATDRLSPRSFRHFLGSSSAALIVADCAGTVAGYALVTFPPRSTLARLYSIAVARPLRGRGIGRLLMDAAERTAVRRGRRAMRLEVNVRNAPAISRYERAGYRLFGRLSDYYADHADALRFEKRLVPPMEQ